MIEFIKNGDLFDSDCEAWVNTVNTSGVMGKGVALGFKQRFHLYYNNYREICWAKELKPGHCCAWNQFASSDTPLGPKWIISFATKGKWWNPSELKWINTGLED